MARKTKSPGIVKLLMEEKGYTRSEIMSAIMKGASYVYRKILREFGLEKGNAKLWREVLKMALPVAWDVLRTKKDLPTEEEVWEAFIKTHRDYRARLEPIVAELKAKTRA